MSLFKQIELKDIDTLSIEGFKEMDYLAVSDYSLPIELMMENAGLHLARLVSSFVSPSDSILIGIGNGNNGGGGLVAARRLVAWGYDVYLDIPLPITKELPLKQLKRALKFGVKNKMLNNPALWVDAYLGFSQRLPLTNQIEASVINANKSNCIRVSLDLPTGFLDDVNSFYFDCHHVLSLGGLKDVLTNLPPTVKLYMADLGIPKSIYEHFNINYPPFQKSSILMIKP